MAGKPSDKPVRNGARTKPKSAAKPARATKPRKAAPTPPPPPSRAQPRAAGAPKSARERHPLSLLDRVHLAQRIALARNKPKADSWPVIAKREGIPARTCQHVYTRFEAGYEVVSDSSGMKVLDETLALYNAAIENLSEGAVNGESWAVRVGATGRLMDALRQRVQLLVVMGRMPRSIQAQSDRLRVEQMLRRMAEVVERHEADPDLVRALLAIIDDPDGIVDAEVVDDDDGDDVDAETAALAAGE